MRSSNVLYLFHILKIFFVFSMVGMSFESIDEPRDVYIVYMGSLPQGEYLAQSNHISMLRDIGHTNIMTHKTRVRSYTKSFNGFAAHLNSKEASKLQDMKGVVSVFKNKKLQIETTRSWNYIGLSLEVPRNPSVESDIIVGHIDSGVLPESDSFSDHDLGPIPKKWKGVCAGGKDFVCNRKIIGARTYVETSAMDFEEGHGTHTASTVIGRVIKNVSFYGLANGTARGGVPSARIAVYKACSFACEDQYTLAAFDDAIADNVDIITISHSQNSRIINLSDDSIFIGSFHAIEKGILTMHSAGNRGNLGFGKTKSFAPWIFSVAASNDRIINNKLVLGNDRTLMSSTVNAFDMYNRTEMVYGRSVTSHCNVSSAMQCMDDCVDSGLVKGKIIVCDSVDPLVIYTAQNVGASGVVLRADINFSIYGPKIVPLPTAILNDSNFQYIESYLKSKTVHTGWIMKSEIIQNQSPILASYSSKGPNIFLPQIFKPDITAPGTNILATFLPYVNPSDFPTNSKTFRSNYTFKTGTSMACPHVSGVVAYVKSKHPDWSASAIKSSIMTSAWNMNSNYNLDDELGHGSGHVDPMKAIDPGLVYETFIEDYFKMFCSLGSEGDKLIKMFKGNQTCSKITSPKDVNYPAMTTSVKKNSTFTVTFLRVVTHVGYSNSTYHAEISTGNDLIYIKVEPNILSFVNLNERKSFIVTVTGKWLNQNHTSCSLTWFDGTHRVRSPILLYASSII